MRRERVRESETEMVGDRQREKVRDRQTENRESDIGDLYSIRDYRVGKHKSIQVPERSFSDEMEQTPTQTESK